MRELAGVSIFSINIEVIVRNFKSRKWILPLENVSSVNIGFSPKLLNLDITSGRFDGLFSPDAIYDRVVNHESPAS